MKAYLFTLVLSESDATHDLLVDEVGVDFVLVRHVPWCEVLTPEEEPPEGVALAHAHLLGVLLALRDGVHYPMHPVTQARDLTLTHEIGHENTHQDRRCTNTRFNLETGRRSDVETGNRSDVKTDMKSDFKKKRGLSLTDTRSGVKT